MNLKLPVIASMVMTVLMLSSCLGTDENTIVYYNDTALTSFSLGTVKLINHTTASDGSDSTYTTTYTPSSNLFYIDQQQGLVYNPDSLPVNTNVEAVLATINTKKSGVAVLELKDREGKDSLVYYSSTDSIDFSKPVNVRVYNLSWTAYRTYTIRVNVHQQSGTEFNWEKTTCSELSQVGMRRMVSIDQATYLFGVENGATVGFRLDNDTWTRLTSTTSLTADAYKSITVKDNYLYILNNGSVLRSADGSTWQTVGSASQLTQLLGASPYKLYAMGTEGLYESADNGATWSRDNLDESTDLLPQDNISFICKPSQVNADTYKLLLFGTRDGVTYTWSKVEEDESDAESAQPWSYYDVDKYNSHQLPKWDYEQVIWYDNSLLAIGGDFWQWYQSLDEGLVWDGETEEVNYYSLPGDFPKQSIQFTVTTDSNHYIYISRQGDERVWKGRLARTAWTEEQTVYTRSK